MCSDVTRTWGSSDPEVLKPSKFLSASRWCEEHLRLSSSPCHANYGLKSYLQWLIITFGMFCRGQLHMNTFQQTVLGSFLENPNKMKLTSRQVSSDIDSTRGSYWFAPKCANFTSDSYSHPGGVNSIWDS